MSLQSFKVIEKLGKGAYSQVYKVSRKEDNQIYALKKVPMANLSEKEKLNALNEVRLLASIENTNVISYKEAFIDEASESLCIIMEYADDGDLFQKIRKGQNDKAYIDEQEIWKIFIHVLHGLKACHDLNIMHRDLKSANVFLSKDSVAKLGDLNVSIVLKKGLGYTQTGTPFYASPEIWRDQPYDYKSDIWSLGCVLYESICLRPPFRATNMEGLYKKVVTGIYPNLPGIYSKELNKVIKAMLQVNPKKRPSAEKLVNSTIISAKIEELKQNTDSAGLMTNMSKLQNKTSSGSDTLADTTSVLLSTIR